MDPERHGPVPGNPSSGHDAEARANPHRSDNEALRRERGELLERIALLEQENRELADRFLEMETLNDNLAALYVASSQLHRTLRLDEVLRAAMEIVVNLVGAETLCIYLADRKPGALTPVLCEGRPSSLFAEVEMGRGPVGRAAAAGSVAICEAGSQEPDSPLVTIPLQHEGRPIGAIAIYEFLMQKDAFSRLDDDLFALLAEHAATAIVAAQLYGRTERKLDTIQGLLGALAD